MQKLEKKKENHTFEAYATLFSSVSVSFTSPSAFSESESKPPAFSKRSSKDPSSNYDEHRVKFINLAKTEIKQYRKLGKIQ